MPASLWEQEVKETGRNGNENHCNFKPKGRRGKNNNSGIPQRGAGPAGQARAADRRGFTGGRHKISRCGESGRVTKHFVHGDALYHQ